MAGRALSVHPDMQLLAFSGKLIFEAQMASGKNEIATLSSGPWPRRQIICKQLFYTPLAKKGSPGTSDSRPPESNLCARWTRTI